MALTTNSVEDMEMQLNILYLESKRIGLKIHRGKPKFMTNFKTTDEIKIEGIEIESIYQCKYLGQTIVMENCTANEAKLRIKQEGQSLEDTKKYSKFQDNEIPMYF